MDALVDAFGRCFDIAAEAGLKFCLEPRVGEQIANTDALLRLIDACGRPNFGAVLDTAHLHAQKEILPLSVEKLGKRIFYLHVADNDGMKNDHWAVAAAPWTGRACSRRLASTASTARWPSTSAGCRTSRPKCWNPSTSWSACARSWDFPWRSKRAGTFGISKVTACWPHHVQNRRSTR